MEKRPWLTTHVLDLGLGKPASGIEFEFWVSSGPEWKSIGKGKASGDGRGGCPLDSKPAKGTYKVRFETGKYFKSQQKSAFYPQVEILFEVNELDEHYHVPLLLNAWGYSTYRGS